MTVNYYLPHKLQVLGQTSLSKQYGPRSEEQSDQGLHCLSFHLRLLDTLLHCQNKLCPIFRTYAVTVLDVQIYRISRFI